MSLRRMILIGIILSCGIMTVNVAAAKKNSIQLLEKETLGIVKANRLIKDKELMPPKYLYKVLTSEAWEESQKGEFLILSADDEAFVHLSTSEQLDRIIGKYWADNTDYVILKIETEKLEGDLRLEANPGGTNKYYHLYNAPIPIDSVNRVL